MFKVLPMVLLMSGCGTAAVEVVVDIKEPPEPYWDYTLKEFYHEFADMAELYEVEIEPMDAIRRVEFGDVNKYEPRSENAYGVCMELRSRGLVQIGDKHIYYRWKEIVIREEQKEYINDPMFLVLMFHEFGHCFLDKNHVDDPIDIMYPQLYPYILNNWGLALGRFFRNGDILEEE